MQKRTLTFNATCFLAILFSTVSVQGMEYGLVAGGNFVIRLGRAALWGYRNGAFGTGGDQVVQVLTHNEQQEESSEESTIDILDEQKEEDSEEPIFDIFGEQQEENSEEHEQEVKQTEKKYLLLQTEQLNENDCLLTSEKLPKDMMSIEILPRCLGQAVDQVESLKISIKTFIRLKNTCKYFTALLTPETIGDLCKNYTKGEKDRLFQILTKASIAFWSDYATRRLPVLILRCAGVSAKIVTLSGTLEITLSQNEFKAQEKEFSRKNREILRRNREVRRQNRKA